MVTVFQGASSKPRGNEDTMEVDRMEGGQSEVDGSSRRPTAADSLHKEAANK
jgi:hypothetical protein